jgi:GH15 family glucan-1,4-alpha-glucosidase
MSELIEQLGFIGDLRTAALISTSGSLCWLCWPDFDSEACFASLLGTEKNGCWTLSPRSTKAVQRTYIAGTNVLETTHTSAFGGIVKVFDFMVPREFDLSAPSSLIRIVKGIRGRTAMETAFSPRFDYGNAQPLIQRGEAGCWSAISGPNRVTLRTDVDLKCTCGDLTAQWIAREGETYSFVLQHSRSYGSSEPAPLDAQEALDQTILFWRDWSARSRYDGPYHSEVERSLLVLKGLTYAPSGGFVAAATTSLPEKVGGTRNWDYRFCWLRDTTFSLLGLVQCGYRREASEWMQWLSRSIQGNPEALRIMYGVSGKREHSEWTAEWLQGYKASRPVHIGNKASDQLQLDTFGEVLDALYRARCHGIYPLSDHSGNSLELPLLEHLERVWDEPDKGLWEFRSGAEQFTESKVMAWVAFDRGIRTAEKFGMKGPVDKWRKIRQQIHNQVCQRGYHKGMKSFTQSYGSRNLDASLLLLPLVGFLPISDPRIAGTVKAIEKRLMSNGLLMRYDTKRVDDGLPPGEGAFLACSFWLVDVYVLQGRTREATALFEKLLSLSCDVGLLSEEYDVKQGLIGNFPQAFSHIGLIHAALALKLGISVRLYDLK